MAAWPSIERSDDQWLVQSLRSGDGTAPVRLYDLYAARLFDYCHVLLRDEEAAALTLLDSLIIVQERIGELADPRLFRGWLYAVTREECLRRRARSELPAERRRAAEATGFEANEATRQLVHTALLVLNGRQREALDLSLRHELNPDELARALGTSPQDASMLVAQARHDLDDAFAAVTVATTGHEDCPSVSALAGPPGRRLDAETCGKLARHIARCPICGVHADRGVDTVRLLNAMPFAAIPAALRERVLTTAVDPRFADTRSTIAMRAELPAEAEPEDESRTTSRLWPAMAAVAFAVLVIGGGVFFVLSDSGSRNAGNNQAIASSPGDLPSDDPSASDSGGPLPSDSVGSPTPTPSSSSSTPTPTPTPTDTASGHPHSSPSAASSSPVQAPAPPPPPAPGTLAVYGCTMHGSRTCTVTVVAQGGPVTWSVTGVKGNISAGGGSSLAAGQSAGVTVTRGGGWCWGNGSGSVSFSSGASASVNWHC
ncbi:MAG: polymerase, sigma-24 subunit, subfamily [Actinoallomurus sp.]|nr:polymerase, sigma-24 subunit, subfamily [Actinoallomurus sp.]